MYLNVSSMNIIISLTIIRPHPATITVRPLSIGVDGNAIAATKSLNVIDVAVRNTAISFFSRSIKLRMFGDSLQIVSCALSAC